MRVPTTRTAAAKIHGEDVSRDSQPATAPNRASKVKVRRPVFALLALDADESAEQDGNSEIACRCKELLVVHGLRRRSFMVSPVGPKMQ